MLPSTILTLELLLLSSLLSGCAGKEWHPKLVPNPATNPAGCGRSSVSMSMVCDPDEFLTKEGRDVVEGYINQGIAPEEGAAPGTGPGATPPFQLAVFIGGKMSTDFLRLYSYDVDTSARHFAQQLHDAWGVGDRVRNDGVLVFVSIEDRVVYVSTGSGVSSRLADRQIQGVVSGMKPHLRAKNYERALSTAVVHINAIMSGKVPPSMPGGGGGTMGEGVMADLSEGFFYALALCAFGCCCLVLPKMYETRRIQRLNRGREALGRLMAEVRLAESEGEEPQGGAAGDKPLYASKSCPICMEDFYIAGGGGLAEGGTEAEPRGVERTNPRRPNALCCGHVFCFGCLDQYLRTPEGTKCPICRAPVDGSRPAAPPPPPSDGPFGGGGGGAGGGGGCRADPTFSSSSSSSSSSYQGIRHNLLGSRSAELHYRLARLRLMYPDAVTPDTVGAIAAGIDTGSVQQVQAAITTRTAAVLQTVSQMQSRIQAQSSGARGSRWGGGGGFGGGRSSGGGGGRW